MRTRCLAAAAAYGLYATAAFASDFLTYEGKDAIHEGRGGERKTVDGVDFWMSGDPPRRYQVLGSIVDRRHQSGLIGLARMSALNHDMAKIAKGAGGDAVILEGEGTDVIGVTSSGGANVSGYGYGGQLSGWGSAWSVASPIRKHDSRWMVIRYLPDSASPPADQATTAPPPH